MKRVLLVCALGLVAGAVALPAMASGNGWSVAVDAGQSMYSKSDFNIAASPGWATKYSTHPTAYRLLVAYKFNDYLGIEGGYVDLGQAKADMTCTTGCTIPDRGTYLDTRADAKGWQLDGVVDYPFADHWMVFGRLGVIDAKVNYTVQSNAFAMGTTMHASDTSVKPTFGVGVGWSVTDNLGVRFSWDRYQSLGSTSSTGKYGVNLVSVGAQYTF